MAQAAPADTLAAAVQGRSAAAGAEHATVQRTGYRGFRSFHSGNVEEMVTDPLWQAPANPCEGAGLVAEPQADPTTAAGGDACAAFGASCRGLFSIDFDRWTFINHGAFGGVLRCATLEAEAWRRRCEAQPLLFLDRELFPQLVRVMRELAACMGCQARDLALLPNATTGLNTVIQSLRGRVGPGDALFSLDIGYGSVKKMLAVLAEQTGAEQVELAVQLPLRLLAASGLLVFIYYIWDWLNDSFFEWFAPLYNNWAMKYPYAGDLGTSSLDAYDTTTMLFTWLPILVAALATILLRALPSGTVPAVYTRARRWVGRVLAWQIPPRRFFTWWCGGMSVADSLVLSWLLAYNIWYYVHYMRRYGDMVDAVLESGVAYPSPRSQLMLEKAALTFGIMLWPNIWVLFFPIPQSSFLQWLTGLGYSQMIRYHRWIGHMTMVVLSLHGWLYYIYWALKHEFWHEFSDWGTLSSINFLAGSIAYVFALVLWATSISWVRRKFFEVFYRCHIVCFLGFTLFSYMHYFWSWSMFLPGLLLYAVDVALRSGQLTNTTLVTGASVDRQSGVATVQMKSSKSMSHCPVHELFLLVPSISRWQWHPITVAGADGGKGAMTTLTLHIKSYGKWSKELLDRLCRRESLAVRVSAPVGPELPSWTNFGSVLLIGGGIGATPLLLMLRKEIRRRRDNPSSAPRVHFVWASRHPHEFCIMDPEILAAAQDPTGWLTIELHNTGAAPLALPDDTDKDAQISPRHSGSNSSMDIKDSPTKLPPGATNPVEGVCPLSSPYVHKHARVIQPQTAGPVHLAVVYLLAWVGAMLGTYLGGAYVGEAYTSWDSAGVDYPNSFYWKVGMVWFFTQAIMSIGLPFALVVAPMHLWRYWRAVGQHNMDELLPHGPAEEPTGHGAGCSLTNGVLTASAGEEGLRMVAGRPDLQAALESAGSVAAKSSGLTKGQVGVFVGGPEPMNRTALLAVSRLNDRCGGPHFEFHAMSHTL